MNYLPFILHYSIFIAFLSRGDFNIIAVDWSNLAAKPWYNKAVENTHPVAKHVAAFIDHMHTSTDTKAKNVQLVGFSLGAHVAGLTAKNVKNGRIRHITGKYLIQMKYTTLSLEHQI